jgi:hypothetical protein
MYGFEDVVEQKKPVWCPSFLWKGKVAVAVEPDKYFRHIC